MQKPVFARHVLELTKRLLGHRYLPLGLAIAAILVMLPALRLGLAYDDLPQRAIALRPDQLPSRIFDTGLVPPEPGSFRTVIRDFFFHCNDQQIASGKRYGVLPWWAPADFKLGLWRPVSAFTHWLDYQLYPESPWLMHAHNIAWFAAIVFVLAIIYRKLMGIGVASGLAALLFLLDGNTYVPVAFVANRGFILSLFFGLMCLYEHHRWRSEKSRFALVLSIMFMALSLFANEGGASTLAFVLAYALVLEPGPFGRRSLTILPAILTIIVWRTVYTLSGFGIFNVGAYIDPISEPLPFASKVIARSMVLIGAQLSHLAPDFLLVVNPSLASIMVAFFCVVTLLVAVVFLPLLRRDKIAAFWFAVMILAAIPAATVVPLSKNLGFVAVGAFGLIARFMVDLFTRANWLPKNGAYRIAAWGACVLLIVAHIPNAVLGRVVIATGMNFAFKGYNPLFQIDASPDPADKNVIVVNAPCSLVIAEAAFYKMYYDEPLPKSMRTLVPGCTSFTMLRTDDMTLEIKSESTDIFSCGDIGIIRSAYVFRNCNLLLGSPQCKKGDRFDLGGLKVEVLETASSGLPSRVTFRFDASLNSPSFHWLQFDWPTHSYKAFKIPAIGQRITISGPLSSDW